MKKLSIIVIILITSCLKETATYSEATVSNDSGVPIEIVGYRYGMVLDSLHFSLQNKEKKKLSEMKFVARGKSNNAGFDNKYLEVCDSIIVTFKDSFSVVHTRYDSLSNHAKVIKPSNLRGFMNLSNWSNIFSEEKLSIYNYYDYTFTEDDYNFAKD